MIEIAFSLAIIGFALVAIIGVLPIGMNVQKDNREETIINADSTVFMNAIRNGAQGLDDLTNYVFAITNDVAVYQNGKLTRSSQYGYTFTSCSLNVYPQFPLTNGLRIVGLLSTPKYMPVNFGKGVVGYYSNHVVAYVRSMSGPAFEKNNPSMQDLAFSYRMTSEVVPYGFPAWSGQVVNDLQANLHDVRLTFRWPLRSRGQLGQGGQSFRTLVGGGLQKMNEPGFSLPNPPAPSPYDLYFFEPRTYLKAP